MLVGLGFAETYTPSLRPDDDTPWKLPEPISVELTALRTSLLPSLVEAARRNVDAGARGIALFEIARVYLPRRRPPGRARPTVAGIAEGGFLHVKGVVEALYAALKAEPTFERGEHPLLHPGQDARRTGAGILGELHPRELEGEWGAFELDLGALFAAVGEPVTYRDVITYPGRPAGHRRRRRRGRRRSATSSRPPARRPARSCARSASSTSTAASRSARAASRSRSRSPTSRPSARSTEEDAARLRDAIVAALAERFGAELRA